MKRKSLFTVAITLILTLVALGLFVTTAGAAEDGYYTYSVSGGKATITDCKTSISGAVTIPATLGGYPVTTIGNYAFYDCSKLTSVTIPESVTTIGDSAFFDCSGLQAVYITDLAAWCAISFGDNPANPLYYAKNLYVNGVQCTELVIPEGVTSIGSYAFRNCSSLTGVAIPEGVTAIGDHAFCGCSSLTSVTIPESVTAIGDHAFFGCSSLNSVTIPESVTTIGKSAFYNCSSLTSVAIGEGVTTIGSCAFYYCSSLTSVTIPDSVTTIGDDAFEGCSGLTSVTIPEGVTTIGDSAFSGCSNLITISVEDGNSKYTAVDGVLFTKDMKALVTYPAGKTADSYSIPDSVTFIGDYAFEGCSSLTSVTILKGVTSIGNYAFRGCSKLTSVTIPKSVTAIGSQAFYNCSRLTSVTIPKSVTSIGNYAFSGCSKLADVYYGGTETQKVAMTIYSYDTPLTNATWHYNCAFGTCGENVSWALDDNGLLTIYGEGAMANYTYSSSAPWYEYRSKITAVEIQSGVTTIGSYAFAHCYSLTSVTIPESVTTIGDWAFDGCSRLADVYYGGTEAQKVAMTIGSDNAPLTNATWHYVKAVSVESAVSGTKLTVSTVQNSEDLAVGWLALYAADGRMLGLVQKELPKGVSAEFTVDLASLQKEAVSCRLFAAVSGTLVPMEGATSVPLP